MKKKKLVRRTKIVLYEEEENYQVNVLVPQCLRIHLGGVVSP